MQQPQGGQSVAGATEATAAPWLLCRASRRLCALPVAGVVETMRVLPIEKLAQAPRFVIGLSLIRGTPTPVMEIGALLGEAGPASRRMITVRTGSRLVALLAEDVLGVRSLHPGQLGDLPPLLRGGAQDVVTAIGRIDGELLLFLRTLRILPDEAALDPDPAGASRSP